MPFYSYFRIGLKIPTIDKKVSGDAAEVTQRNDRRPFQMAGEGVNSFSLSH